MNTRHVAIAGNVNVDMIMGPQAPWPEPGTEVSLPDYELRVGGQAANTAFALEGLGMPFLLLANAGDDVLGRWLRDGFGEAAAHWRLTALPTTVSVGITHPNGERTFFTNRGHLEDFGPADVLPHIPDAVPGRSVALLVGTFLSPLQMQGLPTVITAFERAGYAVAIDTGWPPGGWTERVFASFAQWLPGADILLLNETETRALGNSDDLDAAAAAVRAKLPAEGILVVKRGPDGAQAWQGSETALCAAPPVAVADSIGAGDIFNAGFLAAWMQEQPLQACIEAGAGLASAVIATRPRSYRVSGPRDLPQR